MVFGGILLYLYGGVAKESQDKNGTLTPSDSDLEEGHRDLRFFYLFCFVLTNVLSY